MTSLLEQEVAFISGVDATSRIAATSFGTWFTTAQANPATYGQVSDIFTWSKSGLPGSGASITYRFDANWSDDQKAAIAAAMGLWSAVANVRFSEKTDEGLADFQIISDTTYKGADWVERSYTRNAVGSSVLPVLTASLENRIKINPEAPGLKPITTDLSQGAEPLSTVIHELGHALGLGHGGPYNGNYDSATQQFSAYDTMLWSLMSYIDADDTRARFLDDYPVGGTSWPNAHPLTPMMIDILAIQRLYGVQKEGPLSKGGQVFGFNSNIEGAISMFFDFNRNVRPVVTLWDGGTGNTLDLSGFHQDAVIDLRPGHFSSAGGLKNNIGIAFDTVIETGIGGPGNDILYASDVGSTLKGNAGNDLLVGGAGDDVLSGGAGFDTYDGGGGLNIVRDRPQDLDGDRILHFGRSTTIDFKDALVGRQHVKVNETPEGDTTLQIGDTEIDLDGRFGGGAFFAVARDAGAGPHTEIVNIPFLPALSEGVRVDPASINGIASQLFMTGDGLVSFTATLQAAVSAYANALGWYKVGSDGTIGAVHLLFANTLEPGAVSVDLGTPRSGEKIAFFLVQDGFDRFGNLPDNLSFVQADGTTPAKATGSTAPILHSATLGNLDVQVFHTIAGLNPGQANQVLSGTTRDGIELVLGFEDLAVASGDNDFQDVVLSMHASRDDVFYLL